MPGRKRASLFVLADHDRARIALLSGDEVRCVLERARANADAWRRGER